MTHGQSDPVICTRRSTTTARALRRASTSTLYLQSNGNDVAAGKAVIKSEEERRKIRLRAHFANDTWQKRKEPPLDWAAPLPDWMEKRNENTYLEVKQKELSGQAAPQGEERSLCTIM
ncbi:uncharacterized protein LOC6733246 isoform X2 [Drosophila simulans]|uniref:uncharacterized protein LOC6733246 isoform X2 n=1 Tax=Drosophila simulans TaxID=7240 RepID=UPI00192CF088|nr:uncharacterized protein LOC6733246 isoform X2 [Drosophila simulans]